MHQRLLVSTMKATFQTSKNGIIGELITFDYFHTKLDEMFGRLPPTQNGGDAVEDRLCLQNHIGCFDTGSDLTIRGKDSRC